MKAQQQKSLPQNNQLALDLGPQSVDLKFMHKLEKAYKRMRAAAWNLRGAASISASYSYLNAATIKAVAEKYDLKIVQGYAWSSGIVWKCELCDTAGRRDLTIYFSTEKIVIDLEVKQGGLTWQGKI